MEETRGPSKSITPQRYALREIQHLSVLQSWFWIVFSTTMILNSVLASLIFSSLFEFFR